MMTTLFGVPLCGSLFMPLTIGIATFLFFWIFVFPKKTSQSAVSSDKLQELDPESSLENSSSKTKDKVKVKRKKNNCGDKDGCCSKKNGKEGSCSSKNKAIESAKIFVDGHSSVCVEFASVLSKQFSAVSLAVEDASLSYPETGDLTRHADGSLCVFLMDDSILDRQRHWLQAALSDLTNDEKPLKGMKYTVFMFQSSLDKSNVEAVDQLLHKSGAVRICRAESSKMPSMISSSRIDDWAVELLNRVQEWNEPKRKACKCGPKNKEVGKDQNSDSCSSSSNCSDSEDNVTSKSSTKGILDLEDIGKFL